MFKNVARSFLLAMCVIAAGCSDDKSEKSNQTPQPVNQTCEANCVHGACIIQNYAEVCRCETGYATDAQGLCTRCDDGYQASGDACIEGPIKLPEWDPASEHADIAPSYAGKSGDALYDILGSRIVDGGVNFAVFAEHATRVEVLIFDANNPDTDLPLARLPMKKDASSGIWTIFVKELKAGAHYGYIAFGPNWPYEESFAPGTKVGWKMDCDAEGNRYNPNKLLIDPYARRIHRDFDWNSGNPFTGLGSGVSDWKAAPKSVVVESKYQWSAKENEWRSNRELGDNFEGHAASDLIIYEVHPKGFTAGDKNIANPGSFKAIGEKAQYLADLGVTAVELMPVAEDSETGGYWGYNTIAFFAPEQSYGTQAARNKTEGVIDEFKEMVDKLHQVGIEVILDVVYNHYGEGGVGMDAAQEIFDYGSMNNFKDDSATMIFSLRGLDNKAYYHLMKDNNQMANQAYYDETGIGNQIRTNYKPARRLILDNLHFWVDEMHVDGFRFDLASILGYTDDQINQDVDYMRHAEFWTAHVGETVVQDIVDDDLLAGYHTRLIAEPLSMGEFVLGLFPKSKKHQGYAWFEQNWHFRDLVRQFINFDDRVLNISGVLPPNWSDLVNFGNILLGSSSVFRDGGDERKPYHSINFMTNHDGFTFYDLNSYNEKQNGCSRINDFCCNHSQHAFCQLDIGESNNQSRDWCGGNKNEMGTCNDSGAEAYKRQMIRNDFVFLLISNGTPFILGGDEYMRTQFGNNDAYYFDNEWNWMRWNDWQNDADRVRMHDFVRDMIALRKQYQVFLSPSEFLTANDLQWHGPDGVSSGEAWNGRAIAQYYPAKENTSSLFIMINMYEDSRKFYFPEEGDWNILVDTQAYFESNENGNNIWAAGERKTSGTYDVPGRTIVIAGK